MTDRRPAAKTLVNNWARDDSDLVKVYAFHLTDVGDAQPSEFLIVSGSSTSVDRVFAFGFGPTADVPFPMQIAEVSPEDLAEKQAEQGFLPAGWRLDQADELRPDR